MAHLKNNQFQFCDIIRVDPVFRGLADKVLLRPSGGGITLDGVSLGPNQIIELGEFHDERIVIILEEWFGFEACRKDGSQVPAGLFLAKLAHGRSWAETRKEKEKKRLAQRGKRNGCKHTSCFLIIF